MFVFSGRIGPGKLRFSDNSNVKLRLQHGNGLAFEHDDNDTPDPSTCEVRSL
jgi:hypothetical protein